MNDRIKELAKQSGFLTYTSGNVVEPEAVAKFAELIVKECGEAATFGDPQYSAQHNIHKHFGVE